MDVRTACRYVLILATSAASALGLYLVPALHAQDNAGPAPAGVQQTSATCDFSSVGLLAIATFT